MIRTRTISMLVAVSLSLVVVTPARAGTVLTDGDFLRVLSRISQYNSGSEIFDDEQHLQSSIGVDFSDTATMSRNDGNGFVASAQSQASWAYDPSSPGLGSNFTGVSITGSSTLTSSTNAFYNEEYVSTGYGMSLYVTFDTDTMWSINADFAGSLTKSGDVDALAGYSFQILPGEGIPFPIATYNQYQTETGTIDWSVNESGVLAAGQYIFIMNIGVGADYLYDAAASVQGELYLTNGLVSFTAVPAPGAISLLAVGGMVTRRRRRKSQ